MNRDGVARAALHAFPPSVRARQGEEMLGTLLDVSASSRARFAREIVALVLVGHDRLGGWTALLFTDRAQPR